MLFGGENAESYYDEGLTAAMKGDFEKAVAHFQKATTLDGTLAAAWYQLGRCWLRLGRVPEAVSSLERALTITPKMTLARVELGYAFMKSGLHDRASAAFAAVLDEKPDTPRAALGLGYVAFQQRRWDTALGLAERVAGAGAEPFEAHYLAGRAAHAMKLDQAAANHLYAADAQLDKLIETNPDAPEGYFLRGQIYTLTGEFARALENHTEAERCLEPGRRCRVYNEEFDLVDILAGQGWCHRKMGNPDGARAAAERILELKPGSRRAKWLLSEAGGDAERDRP